MMQLLERKKMQTESNTYTVFFWDFHLPHTSFGITFLFPVRMKYSKLTKKNLLKIDEKYSLKE